MIAVDTNVIANCGRLFPIRKFWLESTSKRWRHSICPQLLWPSFVLAWRPCRPAGEILAAFVGRVRSFDLDASQAYADLMARAKAAGKAIGAADGYIAATAASQNLAVATRDISPFAAAGVCTIDPWST